MMKRHLDAALLKAKDVEKTQLEAILPFTSILVPVAACTQWARRSECSGLVLINHQFELIFAQNVFMIRTR